MCVCIYVYMHANETMTTLSTKKTKITDCKLSNRSCVLYKYRVMFRDQGIGVCLGKKNTVL